MGETDLSRVGEVWEQCGNMSLFLMLRRHVRAGVRGERLEGWEALNLVAGRLDWIPDTCFDKLWWQRRA